MSLGKSSVRAWSTVAESSPLPWTEISHKPVSDDSNMIILAMRLEILSFFAPWFVAGDTLTLAQFA